MTRTNESIARAVADDISMRFSGLAGRPDKDLAEAVEKATLEAIELALQNAAGQTKREYAEAPLPVIDAVFETVADGGWHGTTSVAVKRIERQDDGSVTVVLDYWPEHVKPLQYFKLGTNTQGNGTEGVGQAPRATPPAEFLADAWQRYCGEAKPTISEAFIYAAGYSMGCSRFKMEELETLPTLTMFNALNQLRVDCEALREKLHHTPDGKNYQGPATAFTVVLSSLERATAVLGSHFGANQALSERSEAAGPTAE